MFSLFGKTLVMKSHSEFELFGFGVRARGHLHILYAASVLQTFLKFVELLIIRGLAGYGYGLALLKMKTLQLYATITTRGHLT